MKEKIINILAKNKFNVNGTKFDCAIILNADKDNVYVVKKDNNCKCYLLAIQNGELIHNCIPDIIFEGNFESNKHRIACVYANIA